MSFHTEGNPVLDLPSSEGMASPQPNHLVSIIPDPAPSSRFSLHGLGTLLLPQAPQTVFKHRNRNTALISPSRPTFERHSKGTAENEWEDLGDADSVLDEVKGKARLAAWTVLTSSTAPDVISSDVSALSTIKQDEVRDRPRVSPLELSPLALSRTESISTASLSIDLDALHSVTSHLHSPFTPVADQLSTSVWEETQFGAMRSSTDLVHGSLESTNALADLINMLGLDSNGTEGEGPSNIAPTESKSSFEVPLRAPRNDILLGSPLAVIPPLDHLLPPSPATKYATMSASHPSTLDPSDSLTKSTLFSLRKGSNFSFHPILDIEAKKCSVPVTTGPKTAPLLTHYSCDPQVPEPPGPRNKHRSFLPDMSGPTIQRETRSKKNKRPATAPQPSRPYMDQLPPTADSLLPEKKGKSRASSVFPRLLSRSAKPPPPHWPPISPSQTGPLGQTSVARTPTRPNTLKASRIEHRASRMNRSDSSLGSSFPPLPIMPNPNTY